MNRYEREIEVLRLERNVRTMGRVLIGLFCVAIIFAVAIFATALTAWDAGRDYGQHEQSAECQRIAAEWAELQSHRKEKPRAITNVSG